MRLNARAEASGEHHYITLDDPEESQIEESYCTRFAVSAGYNQMNIAGAYGGVGTLLSAPGAGNNGKVFLECCD